MEIDPSDFENLDRLALTNTITMSALVAILTRKGIIQEGEMMLEIQRLREQLTAGQSPDEG